MTQKGSKLNDTTSNSLQALTKQNFIIYINVTEVNFKEMKIVRNIAAFQNYKRLIKTNCTIRVSAHTPLIK